MGLIRLPPLLRTITTLSPRLSPPQGLANPAHASSLPVPPPPPHPIAHSPVLDLPVEELVPLLKQAAATVAAATPSTPVPEPLPEPTLPVQTPTPVARVRRPVGGFRGGLLGFLLGSSLVGLYGYFALLDDYKAASNLLLMSVEELKDSTEKMTTHIKRIEKVEEDVGGVLRTAALKRDVEALRAEYRQLIEAEHLDHLDLKAHVWGVEQDLHALSKRGTNEVRI